MQAVLLASATVTTLGGSLRGHDCRCRQHANPRNLHDALAGATTAVPQLEPTFDFADLPVELDDARPLLPQGLHDHRRRPRPKSPRYWTPMLKNPSSSSRPKVSNMAVAARRMTRTVSICATETDVSAAPR